MKTPPSWLTRPCPNGVETGQQQRVGFSEGNHQKSTFFKRNFDDENPSTTCKKKNFCWISSTNPVLKMKD